MRALLNHLDYLLLDMRSKLGLITVILNDGFAPAHVGLCPPDLRRRIVVNHGVGMSALATS
jgi:hypothetical protein